MTTTGEARREPARLVLYAVVLLTAAATAWFVANLRAPHGPQVLGRIPGIFALTLAAVWLRRGIRSVHLWVLSPVRWSRSKGTAKIPSNWRASLARIAHGQLTGLSEARHRRDVRRGLGVAAHTDRPADPG